ncbi:hypothetical protein DPMN_164265 [Dreissena polymorpha]|uniref:Uncharacterized protein n=1 Tax=Dreissena polymorpha TaxID=45954 RepID=A0A9D4ETV5_DREPO|nr:hypothetical protein DPMN_164265 [Dreissena polymorpha]
MPVKRRKLVWFEIVIRHDSLCKTVNQRRSSSPLRPSEERLGGQCERVDIPYNG